MKKDMALRGIGFAVLFNFIIVLVPITVGLLDIFNSTRLVDSPYHELAGKLQGYSVFSGYPDKFVYIIFVLEWIICAGIMYILSSKFSANKVERKQLLIWFAVAFPFASHLMWYVMGVILAYFEFFKLGFV